MAGKTRPTGFDAIWEAFEGRSIKKVELQNGSVVETSTLTYYGKDSTDTTILDRLAIESVNGVIQSPSQYATVAREVAISGHSQEISTQKLLAYQDGRCGVWQIFMIDVLRTQGISTKPLDIEVKSGISINSFKVKSDAAGQGISRPKESIWGDHAVVEFGGKVYDPSYGLEYGVKSTALATFMSQSVESVGTTRYKRHGETTLGYGLVYEAITGENQSADDYFQWYEY